MLSLKCFFEGQKKKRRRRRRLGISCFLKIHCTILPFTAAFALLVNEAPLNVDLLVDNDGKRKKVILQIFCFNYRHDRFYATFISILS